MVVFGRTQRTWKCFYAERILFKYGRKRRKKGLCQRTMDRYQHRGDQKIVQFGCTKGWIKVQETTKGNKALKDSRPCHNWKGRVERNKNKPVQMHYQGRLNRGS